jgi:Zn finger protein HypA/HybF involved in hydrogenase expression
MLIIAENECLNCHHKWSDKPGPVTCPKCGSEYVKWLNYEQLAEQHRKMFPLGKAFGG